MPKLIKQIVKAGKYLIEDPQGPITDEKTGVRYREEVIDEQRLSRWVGNHREMQAAGLKIPCPWRHDPKAEPVRLSHDLTDVDSFNNAGFWEHLWVDEAEDAQNEQKAKALFGLVDIPDPDKASKFGTEVRDTSILAKPSWKDSKTGKVWNDVLTHIAVVTHPVESGQPNFRSSEMAVFAMSNYLGMASPPDDNEPIMASGGIETALKVLRKVGLRLPDDTTAENLLERIITAGVAVYGSDDDDEETNGNNQEPEPVAMGALNMTQQIQKFDPYTGKPLTADQIADQIAKSKIDSGEVTLQMSKEDQAAVAAAKNMHRTSYKQRIEALVSSGRITRKFADEDLLPLLPDLQMSFNEKGELNPTPLDTILKPLEKAPAATALTGKSLTMSMGNTVRHPEDDTADDVLPDEEAIERVIEQQARASGRLELIPRK